MTVRVLNSATSALEAALLAVLPRGPRVYDPFRHPERVRARRDVYYVSFPWFPALLMLPPTPRSDRGMRPASAIIVRTIRTRSTMATSRGHRCTQVPQVVQRQISSASISVRPKVASRISLRMLKLRIEETLGTSLQSAKPTQTI